MSKYRINASTDSSPNSWDFQGSHNGTDWTILDTQTDQINWTDSEWRDFTFTNNTAYTYYRIYVTAVNHIVVVDPPYIFYYNFQINFSELELYSINDSDADGLSDLWEIIHFGNINLNGPNGDPDSDGLSNLEEYTNQTDPLNSDTDDDGLTDGWECQNGYDPIDSDMDDDGLPDGFEVENGLDPFSAETDAEDYVLVSVGGTASASATEPNFSPNNAFDSNIETSWSSPQTTTFITQWLQYELSSQMGAARVNRYRIQASMFQSPKSWDFQGSNNGTDWTILDTRSNQIYWAENEWREFTFTNNNAYTYFRIYVTDVNPYIIPMPPYEDIRMYHINIIDVELRYNDFDGLPNWWEMMHFPNLDRGPNDDPDNDGLFNLGEYANNTDPNNSDTDNDDMPDGWEVENGLNPLVNDAADDPDTDNLSNLGEYQNQTDPFNFDTDSDDMADGWEVQYGLNPLVDDASGDFDVDGFENSREYTVGSDPSDPNSIPQKKGVYYEYDALGRIITVTEYE